MAQDGPEGGASVAVIVNPRKYEPPKANKKKVKGTPTVPIIVERSRKPKSRKGRS